MRTKSGKAWGPFKNRYFSTFVVVLMAFLLAMSSPDGKGALKLWPVFGALNQLLAALALILGTVYLIKKRLNPLPTLLPAIFMTTTTITATVMNIKNYVSQQNYLLVFIASATLIIAVWMIIESVITVTKFLKMGQTYKEEFRLGENANEYVHID